VSGATTLLVQPHVEVDTNIRPEPVPTQHLLTVDMTAMEMKKRL